MVDIVVRGRFLCISNPRRLCLSADGFRRTNYVWQKESEELRASHYGVGQANPQINHQTQTVNNKCLEHYFVPF